MEEPRRPLPRGTYRPSSFPPRRSSNGYRRRRWWRPFGLTPNQFELAIGLVLVFVAAVAKLFPNVSFTLDKPLELVSLGAIALAVGWCIYVLGKRIWHYTFRRRDHPSFPVATGLWGSQQTAASGRIPYYRRRPTQWAKPRPGQRRMPLVWLTLIGLAGGTIVGSVAFMSLPHFGRRPSSDTSSISLRLCGSSRVENCVVDGDTIHWGGAKIRIADIDTPEIFSPKCSAELALGQKAKTRLLELMNAGPFEVVRAGGRDEDVYGRKLRLVTRDGQSVGDTLIAEGLARRWDGARRSWC
jgi:micrococcal nuclease